MSVALKPNTEIAGLTLIDVIGRGGFGITYKAIDRASQITYALKEYLPDGMSNRDPAGLVSASAGQEPVYERGLEAFMSEANILKDLPRRRGLVRVRGAFEKFGTAYCVMEYIEGDSLDRMVPRVIQKFGHVPANLVAELAVSMCWALAALHAEKLIHRDVKPANIMLRKDGEPVLIDFGAARRLSRRGVKETIFTRKYAALEQFPPEMNGFGREFDEGPWSDLYSLSVVLYELVSKAPPPDAADRAVSVLQGKGDPYRPLADDDVYVARYPASLLEVIDRGCGLMPKERTASAENFARQVDAKLWTTLATAEQTTPDKTTGVTKQGQRATPRWLGAILMFAAAGGALVYWYDQTFHTEVF